MLAGFVIVVVLFSFYVFSAIFNKDYKNISMEATETDDLQLRKQEILAGLTDLEYDFQMKKMKEEDYRHEKEKLLSDGAGILQKLDEMKPPVKSTFKKKRKSAA